MWSSYFKNPDYFLNVFEGFLTLFVGDAINALADLCDEEMTEKLILVLLGIKKIMLINL